MNCTEPTRPPQQQVWLAIVWHPRLQRCTKPLRHPRAAQYGRHPTVVPTATLRCITLARPMAGWPPEYYSD